MADIKLFRMGKNKVEELDGTPAKLEKTLQGLLQANLDTFLQIDYLATEYSTGKTHSGRIDTLGIDENGCPVIIEYKKNTNANVINQGLFYLDWLMDHKADFELLVLRTLGQEKADSIDWSAPRLLCIAEDFSRYDVHAIQQINRNIELIRYRRFGEDLLMLYLLNAVVATPETEKETGSSIDQTKKNSSTRQYVTQSEYLDKASDELKKLYLALSEFMISLGDEVQEHRLKWYIAFRAIKNFACVQIHSNYMLIWLKLNVDDISMEDGFSRSVRGIGHHGTGELELIIRSLTDLEKAKPYIQQSFEEN